jgi:hypothetical protein
MNTLDHSIVQSAAQQNLIPRAPHHPRHLIDNAPHPGYTEVDLVKPRPMTISSSEVISVFVSALHTFKYTFHAHVPTRWETKVVEVKGTPLGSEEPKSPKIRKPLEHWNEDKLHFRKSIHQGPTWHRKLQASIELPTRFKCLIRRHGIFFLSR